MAFLEIVDQVVELLRTRGRVSYHALKREFALDDAFIEDLKEELVDIQELAVDKNGKMLVWQGDEEQSPSFHPLSPRPEAPASYTPPHLAERIRAEQAAMESRGAADGERKTITALFADLKGSTALIEGLDPEDARAIIDPALQVMMDAVHRYDGYVAQALGDGIFALFGAPIAHEDHPQRALYAALRMQEEMRGYSDQVRLKHGIPLQMRVGINTGEVVVRSIRKDDLHTDYVSVGHSTNLAARMEQMANPGSIVISEYTRKLTEGYFNLKALGAAEIKGVDEPLNVYEVLGAGPLRTRLQVSARRGLTRFVGRHSEMEQIQQALAQAKDGHGQIVGMMGEPGLGKSRLFYEFKLTSQSSCLVLEAFAVSHGKSSPYLPLIELLRNYFQLEPTDDERTRKEKVGGKVLMLDRSLEDTLPYLFALLGIEDPASSLQQMDAQIRRQRTFEALKKLFLRESVNQPLILIFEDLHWIDTETQGLLDTLSESVASAHALLLVNYRPEYRHEWGQKTYYIQLRLAPLGKEEAEELLTFLLGTDVGATGRSPLQTLKQLILEKTDGTPFFMEEVVQTLVEEGALIGERGNYRLETTPTELHISPTVQGVLAARIDRLAGAEKELLQQLSVIGRQFPASLVKQVVSQTEDEIYRLLSSLQTKEFLYEQPAFPEMEYVFKHALTQDVAYGTVLQEQRKALHEQTGLTIETLYADSLDEHYGELAHHYSQSGNTEKAIEYLGLAGHQAVAHSAHVEAIERFTQALALLQTRPASPDRDHQELTFHIALGQLFIATRGWGSDETNRVFARAKELSQQTGNTAQLFATVWGRYMGHVVVAEFQQAQALAKELGMLATRLPDPMFRVQAHCAQGYARFYQGEFEQARAFLEQAIALYDPQRHPALVSLFTEDSGVTSRAMVAWILWTLGYPDQSLQMVQDARTLAEDLAHPFSLTAGLAGPAMVHELRREVESVRDLTEAAITMAQEHGFAFREALVTVWQCWARVGHQPTVTIVEQLRQGVARYQAMGGEAFTSHFLVLLAGGYGKCGQVEDGLNSLREAVAFIEKTGERHYEAELYRVKGALLLQAGDEAEAEACFHQALDIARPQRAKSWELRTATSLARLWQQQGKTPEAAELLAPVYSWFTEGFDTADLKDAKALLEGIEGA